MIRTTLISKLKLNGILCLCRLQEEKARLEEERLMKEREVGTPFMLFSTVTLENNMYMIMFVDL